MAKIYRNIATTLAYCSFFVSIHVLFTPSRAFTYQNHGSYERLRHFSISRERVRMSEKSKSNEGMKLRGPDAQPPRPNSNTYWVTDHLIAGEYPADNSGENVTRRKLGKYLDLGINFFIDLTHEGEKTAYEGILKDEAKKRKMEVGYKRLSIDDFGIPTKETMEVILNTIDSAITKQKTVYVHCRGGIGRTGATVGCFLARNGNTGEEALEETNRLFQFSDRAYMSSHSPETREQMEFVKCWNG